MTMLKPETHHEMVGNLVGETPSKSFSNDAFM